MRRVLPMVMQSETSECGTACLAMIVNFYGYKVDMTTMRRRHSTSIRGQTLSDLVLAARQLHLAARAVRIEPCDLGTLRVPCILHWEMSHFVVLRAAGKRKITIHDPAVGVRSVPLAEVGQ